MSKIISIPEDLGHWCDWRTCRSRRGILHTSTKFCRKIPGCVGLLILTDSSQRSFSRFWSLFLEHSEDGPHTLLNGGLRRIPITLTWECCRDLLNLHLQHLIVAQLVLCGYSEAVHLGIYVLQELVSGMNLLANFIIYPYLIPYDISERGLISVEILPHTTLLAIVERKTRFVPSSIEALIRMKAIAGVTNEVDILGDRRVVDAHVACFSTIFTRYSGIYLFEMIEAQVLKHIHKNINLGSEHVHPFKLVNLLGAGLSVLLIPALVRGRLLNHFTSFLNTKSEERASRGASICSRAERINPC
jgi:hypothetical protein